MDELTRFGVSIPPLLLEKFDRLIKEKGYPSRSEALRDMIRDHLVEQEWESDEREVVGTVTLIYDHHSSNLLQLLNEIQHQYQPLIVSTLHVHLDHHHCLEVLVIKGPAQEARQISSRLISMKGVKHGKLTITSTGKELP
ncbi:MAG: nickel-responsive transcriptional regulator NikR [Syntrophomonadaceae bacterium]|nr:nickel-responsive transcriptional regulator NikR [Syntrophomonadaceae bacterium]